VVIDAFETPAALAARGVTGTAVTSGILDELMRLQQATRTATASLTREKRSLANAWSNDVKQGHATAALAKYDEALQYAPHWSALQQARVAAAGRRS